MSPICWLYNIYPLVVTNGLRTGTSQFSIGKIILFNIYKWAMACIFHSYVRHNKRVEEKWDLDGFSQQHWDQTKQY